MRLLSLLAVLGAFALSGCDSASSDGDCGNINVRSGGTISATYGSESFRLSCYDVTLAFGRTIIIGYDIGAGGADIRTPITITIDGTSPGPYSLDEDDEDMDDSLIQLSLGGDATSASETGSMRVSEFSRTRLRGTFSFTTRTGIVVSDGTFDLDVSGVEEVGSL